MATVTLTIELSEEAAANLRAAAEAQGRDVNTFAVAVIEDAVAADEAAELDEQTFTEVVAACLRGIEDVKAGRVFTLEEVKEHGKAALNARRAERERHRRTEQAERLAA